MNVMMIISKPYNTNITTSTDSKQYMVQTLRQVQTVNSTRYKHYAKYNDCVVRSDGEIEIGHLFILFRTH